ncbi:hypothetical protein Efla_006969 [Eimeria flavescens]
MAAVQGDQGSSLAGPSEPLGHADVKSGKEDSGRISAALLLPPTSENPKCFSRAPAAVYESVLSSFSCYPSGMTADAELVDYEKASQATQSLTREQEVQTDPYSPDYICSQEEFPDELAITHLCWARGLPVGSLEIRIIQEMQVQRRLERLLPPPTDEFCLGLRTTLMERQEFFKWAHRERDFRELQDRRLELVEMALKLRASKIRAKNDAAARPRQKTLKDQMLRRGLLIERRRLQELRRLWRRRNAITQSLTKPLCAANKLKSSRCLQLYAPPARDGYRPPDLFTSFPTAVHWHAVRQIMFSFYLRSFYISEPAKALLIQALEHTSATLQKEVAAELLTGTSLQLQIDFAAAPTSHSVCEGRSVASRRHIKRNIRARPETPRVEEVSIEEEQEVMAVLLLQQLLRGAARRQAMIRGKEKSLDLVNMLRAAEQLEDLPPRQQQEAVDRQTALESAELLLASAQGAAIAEVLDELAKEQRRMEEVQRISALAHLAMRERRLREAQELGTRQAEEMLRERENEAFRNAMRIHNQTVDSYLQAIIEKAGARHAKEEALEELRMQAKHLADVVDELEEQCEAPTTVVGGLIRGFLLPRLENQCRQRDDQLEAHKFHVASRLAVEDAVSSALSGLVQLAENRSRSAEKAEEDSAC